MEPMTGGEQSISKRKSEQINFFNPSFFIVHKTSSLIYSTNQLNGFFIVGTLELKNLTNIKSANWFLIDFLSNVKLFYMILLTVYEA